jgi:hypothetical protein
VGYDTTRALYTPFQNRPTIQLTVGTATIYQVLNGTYYLQSVILDANSQTAGACANTSGEFFYVKVMNFTSMGIKQNGGTAVAILCEATGGNGASACIQANLALYCVSHNNTQSTNQCGISSVYAYGCISYGNSQSGIAIQISGYAVNCTAYGNGDKGFYWGNVADTTETAINCIAEANATYGYFVNSGLGQMINCASYNNTSGRKNTASFWAADIGPITGSGSFFNNAAGGDFGLNSTAGAGALARAASFPGTSGFANLSSTKTYQDLGAAQHQDTGGAAAGLPPEPIIIARGTPF